MANAPEPLPYPSTHPTTQNMRRFLYLKSLQEQRNTHRNSVVGVFSPLLPYFRAAIANGEFINSAIHFGSANQRFTPQKVPRDIPYQFIGGDAVAVMENDLRATGKSVFPRADPRPDVSPDIDVELAPLMEYRNSANGSQQLYYVPLFIQQMVPPQLTPEQAAAAAGGGGAAMPPPTYQTAPHPAYVHFGSILSANVSTFLAKLSQLPALQPTLAALDPITPEIIRADPEAIHELPAFSRTVGKFHVSLIFNPKYVSKVQVLIVNQGKAEHILELIFASQQTPLEEVYTSPTTQLLVPTPLVLFEKNVIAAVNRMKKKQFFEDSYDSKSTYARNEAALPNIVENIIRLNTKILLHLERAMSCIVAMAQLSPPNPERFRKTFNLLLNYHQVRYEDLISRYLATALQRPDLLNAVRTLYQDDENLTKFHRHLMTQVARLNAMKATVPPVNNGAAPNAAPPASTSSGRFSPTAAPFVPDELEGLGDNDDQRITEEDLRASPVRITEAPSTVAVANSMEQAAAESARIKESAALERQQQREAARRAAAEARAEAARKQEQEELALSTALSLAERERQNRNTAAAAAANNAARRARTNAASDSIDYLEDVRIICVHEPPSIENMQRKIVYSMNKKKKVAKTLVFNNRGYLMALSHNIDTMIENPKNPLAIAESVQSSSGNSALQKNTTNSSEEWYQAENELLETIKSVRAAQAGGVNAVAAELAKLPPSTPLVRAPLKKYIIFSTLPSPQYQFYIHVPKTNCIYLYERASVYYTFFVIAQLLTLIEDYESNPYLLFDTLNFFAYRIKKISLRARLDPATIAALREALDRLIPFSKISRFIKLNYSKNKSEYDQMCSILKQVCVEWISILIEDGLREAAAMAHPKEKSKIPDYLQEFALTRDGVRAAFGRILESCPSISYVKEQYIDCKYKIFEYILNLRVIIMRRTIAASCLEHTEGGIKPNVYISIPYSSMLDDPEFEGKFVFYLENLLNPFTPYPIPSLNVMKILNPSIASVTEQELAKPNLKVDRFTIEFNIRLFIEYYKTRLRPPYDEYAVFNLGVLNALEYPLLIHFRLITFGPFPFILNKPGNKFGESHIFGNIQQIVATAPRNLSRPNSESEKVFKRDIVTLLMKSNQQVVDLVQTVMRTTDLLPSHIDTIDYIPGTPADTATLIEYEDTYKLPPEGEKWKKEQAEGGGAAAAAAAAPKGKKGSKGGARSKTRRLRLTTKK
jgi:hypothetical protein